MLRADRFTHGTALLTTGRIKKTDRRKVADFLAILKDNPVSAVIDTVRSDAVKLVGIARDPVLNVAVAERVLRDGGQIVGHKFRQVRWQPAVIELVCAE